MQQVDLRALIVTETHQEDDYKNQEEKEKQ